MTEYASFEDLTSVDATETVADVPLSSGKSVRVRALTRYELMLLVKGEPDNLAYERRIISTCLVNPALSESQVEAWQKRALPSGDLSVITDAIRTLSGLGEGADKSNLS